jgi:cysteine desulfurase
MRIYLDHNASTPLRECARTAMMRCIEECGHGNPASVHRSGQRARGMLEDAREQVASLIGAPARSVVFTSGGTEANNLAILGAVESSARSRRKIVSSAIEHSSVLAPLAHLEGQGSEVVRIAPASDGRIAPEAVIEAIDDETALVTLGLANSETGALQDLTRVSEAVRRAGARFHVDAVQAVGRSAVSLRELNCDALTVSAHKLGGPAGIGALYLGPDVVIAQQSRGGPQERGLRAGTPNLIGAVGFGAAAEECQNLLNVECARVADLSEVLLSRLLATIPGLRLNSSTERICNTLNLTFPGVLGESMLIALDLEGVEVSMGSACAAGAVEPSHVLLAMGRSVAEARSSLRLSMGWSTTPEEIARAVEIIPRVWRRVEAAEPTTVLNDSVEVVLR